MYNIYIYIHTCQALFSSNMKHMSPRHGMPPIHTWPVGIWQIDGWWGCYNQQWLYVYIYIGISNTQCVTGNILYYSFYIISLIYYVIHIEYIIDIFHHIFHISYTTDIGTLVGLHGTWGSPSGVSHRLLRWIHPWALALEALALSDGELLTNGGPMVDQSWMECLKSI